MPRLDEPDARRRFAAQRIARLATVRPSGGPHLVPVAFALEGDTLAWAVDHKPKTTTALQRLANLRHDPRCSLLVDHVDDEDWSQLWWVRVDGVALVLDEPARDHPAIGWLTARHPQYQERPPEGPLVLVHIAAWTGWTAAG